MGNPERNVEGGENKVTVSEGVDPVQGSSLTVTGESENGDVSAVALSDGLSDPDKATAKITELKDIIVLRNRTIVQKNLKIKRLLRAANVARIKIIDAQGVCDEMDFEGGSSRGLLQTMEKTLAELNLVLDLMLTPNK